MIYLKLWQVDPASELGVLARASEVHYSVTYNKTLAYKGANQGFIRSVIEKKLTATTPLAAWYGAKLI